jgi:hypothetical protein
MHLNNFYVYVHRRASDNSIFYVGKGKRYRAWDKQGRSEWWKRIVNKHGLIVEIIIARMEQPDAFQLEKDLIKFYEGNLINQTGGGDGGGVWLDPSRLIRYSEMMKKRWESTEYREKRSRAASAAMMDNPERRQQVSEMLKARHRTPDYTARVAEAARRKHAKKVCRGDGVIFNSVIEAAIAMGATDHGNIGNAARGKRKTAYGYTWTYI